MIKVAVAGYAGRMGSAVVDAVTAATAKLKTTPTQTIKISAVGDINCISCYYVAVTDGATGLSGRYWIASDKHTWSNGIHKMDLILKFEAVMSEVETKEVTQKKVNKTTNRKG